MKKTIIGLTILFIVVFVTVSYMSNKAESAKVSTESQTKKVENIKKNMGEEIDINGISYTVNKVDRSDKVGKDYSAIEAKGEFVVVDILVKNNNRQASIVDASLFRLAKDDYRYEYDSTASVYANSEKSMLSMTSLNPGLAVNSKVVFDVPKGTKEFKFKIAPDKSLVMGEISFK